MKKTIIFLSFILAITINQSCSTNENELPNEELSKFALNVDTCSYRIFYSENYTEEEKDVLRSKIEQVYDVSILEIKNNTLCSNIENWIIDSCNLLPIVIDGLDNIDTNNDITTGGSDGIGGSGDHDADISEPGGEINLDGSTSQNTTTTNNNSNEVEYAKFSVDDLELIIARAYFLFPNSFTCINP